MATAAQIMDRAARITGARTTGTERQIALDAVNDVYLDSLMMVQHEQKQYTHKFRDSTNDFSVEKYNKTDFSVLGKNRIVNIPGPGLLSLESVSIEALTVQIRSTDLLTTYIQGTNYTVDGPNGNITNINIPAGDAVVQYLLSDRTSLPGLRDADIQIPPNLRIINVVYKDGSNSAFPMVHVSDSELLEYRRGYTAQGFSRIYSTAGDGIIRLWPRPAVNDTITFTLVPKPPILTEGPPRPPAFWGEGIWDVSEWDDARGAENAPSMLPDQFHWSVLLPGTVVQLLDKDQRMEQAQWWQGRYEAGIEKMMLWIAMYGGDPTPIFDRTRPEFVNYPDQWNRRY